MLGVVIALVGWLTAAGITWWQLRATRAAARVQRAIDFHEVLTTGEVGGARDRLATLMWHVGEQAQAGKCFRPTFSELLGPLYSRGVEAVGFSLGSYPDAAVPGAATTPLQDLYRLLWAFERIEAAARHRLIDVMLMKELLDHHVVWWDTLASEISETDTRHRGSLARLGVGARARDRSLDAWAAADFVSR